MRQVLKQNLLFNNHLISFLPVTFKQPVSDSHILHQCERTTNRKKNLFIVEPIISGKISTLRHLKCDTVFLLNVNMIKVEQLVDVIRFILNTIEKQIYEHESHAIFKLAAVYMHTTSCLLKWSNFI